MEYFGYHINSFLAEAEVFNGYESGCVLSKMRADKRLTDVLLAKLNDDEGDHFMWRDEVIRVHDGLITSNTRNTQLKQFYGLHLHSEASDINHDFKKSIESYKQARQLDKNSRFGYMFVGFNEGDFLKAAAIEAIDAFLNTFYRAFEHVLIDKDAFDFTGEMLFDVVFKDKLGLPRFNDIDWVLDELNLYSMAMSFFNGFDVDAVNDVFLKKMSKVFTYNFCNKRDFNSFIKFTFCNFKMDTSGDTIRDHYTKVGFNESVQAFSEAFASQDLFSSASDVLKLEYKELIEMDLGGSFAFGKGMSITRRKYLFEIKMPHELAQKLQIFLLKYNRDGVTAFAA